MAEHSKACCSTPVAQSEGYSPKGRYETYADTKTYVVGSESADKAVFFIYDIFGYRDQTMQGADILANAGYLVVMPDLFHGKPAEPAWFADQEGNKDKIGAFMQSISDFPKAIEQVHTLHSAAKEAFPSAKKWASIGYCWGGKLVSVTSGEKTPWTVSVQTSPARVEASDAEKVTVPMMMLASKDEPADAVKAFDAALKTPKKVETFDTQIHGWMSARADLKNAEVKKEYERGYHMVINFLKEHLQ